MIKYWNLPTLPAWNLSAYRGIKGDDAPNVKFQYSADGENWHNEFNQASDIYMRTSNDGGQTWSGGMEFIQDLTELQTDVADLKENKANFDGYYEQMTVGSAENLVGDTVNTDTYLERFTGGNDNEVANGVASVVEIKGNSKVWNQKLMPKSIPNSQVSDVTFTGNDDGSYTVVVGSDKESYVASTAALFNFELNHKYYCRALRDSSYILFYSATYGLINRAIITIASNINNRIMFRCNNDTTAGTYHIKPYIVDLTLIFGAGNEPATVDEFEAWLAQTIGLKPYYAYNGGSILNANLKGFTTIGRNLLNPTTMKARLLYYEYGGNGGKFTVKNLPSGATMTFTPDSTGVAETITATSNTITVTEDGTLELSAATTNTYVCAKWDGSKDNDVMAYEEHSYDFDVTKVYGKLNGEGSYVQCFPSGMKRVKESIDSLSADIARVAVDCVVDLGSLNWTKETSANYSHVFKSRLPYNAVYRGTGWSSTQRVVVSSSRYVTDAGYYDLSDGQGASCLIIVGLNTESGGNYNTKNIFIKHSDCESVADFLTKINGVSLIYERYNKPTFTDLIYSNDGGQTGVPFGEVLLNMQVNNWGTEQAVVSDYVDGAPTSCAPTISTIYSIDAAEWIDSANNGTFISEDSMDAFMSALSSALGTALDSIVTMTKTWSEENGSYNFSIEITPNEQSS